jgi:hypothetical protein
LLGVRVREKVPLRVKGLVTKVSIRVEVWLCEVEVGYASGEGEEEGMVKDGGKEVEGKEGTGAEREEASASGTRCCSSQLKLPPPPPPKLTPPPLPPNPVGPLLRANLGEELD